MFFFQQKGQNNELLFDKHMSQLVVGYNCLDDSGCMAISLQMNESHEHFNYAHNMQLQVHPHNHPLGDTTSAQNALDHENARATVHVLGPPNIMLFTRIRFLNRLRSTASPILSHFHTLLRLTLAAPITVSGFNSCQALNFPLKP